MFGRVTEDLSPNQEDRIFGQYDPSNCTISWPNGQPMQSSTYILRVAGGAFAVSNAGD